jgi:glutamyl-tRNA synthetase
MYGGKFYLRFEDTDPRLKRPVLEFYDLIREDLIWLGCKWDEEFIQSERLPIYYEHARKLLEIGGAFVCTCDKEVFRRKILSKQPCPCRNLPVTEQLARWDKMLDGTYEEGDAIVRVKTDVSHPNPAVRDWPALRIIDTTKHPHPRVGSKYHVWPLYNFACGLDDHLNGITHIIRGKEHVTNEARQKYMYMHFGWSYPEAIHYGRLRVVGAALSKSKIMKALADGTVESFSDPRLATLASLRRRGITSEALRRMVIEVGPKPVDVTISWENIYAYNRKIVDPAANRYFFIPNPIIMTVSGLTKDFTSTIALHPNHLDRGYRKLYVKQFGGVAKLAISADDLKLLKEHEVVRLMELFNVKVNFISEKRVEASFLSEPYTEAKKVGAPLIQWLPAGTGIETNVVMPTANVTKGLAEDACRQLSENTIIQFERFGFVKIDKITQNLLIAYYAHR